ncbi:MAG: hypothetical protein JXA21_05560 [Anaerolineae bacterium]|nr:hypothetical protein [Anaerolineae bacterium]
MPTLKIRNATNDGWIEFPAGGGDMLKADYDPDDDGSVIAADYAANAGLLDGNSAAAFEAAGTAAAVVATHAGNGSAHHTRYSDAEAVAAATAAIHAAAAKATPVDGDETALLDSASSYGLKRLTWAAIKATLKTYFDTLYNLYAHPNHTGDVTSVGDGATTIANKQSLTATLPVTISNSPTVIAGAAPVIAINVATTEAAGVSELATDAEVAAATAGVIPTVPQLPLYRQTATNALQADTGGNARGVNAMDLQSARAGVSQVASGNYSSIPGGYGNVTSGDYSHAMGRQNTAGGAYAIAEGYLAAAALYGEHAHAAGAFAAQGGAQYRRFVLRRSVTVSSAFTWYQLFLDGSSALLTIPSNALWNFTVKIVGLTNGAAQRWSYDVSGTIVNDGGTVALLESAVTSRYESDSAYAARVVGNNTDDSLDIEVSRSGGSTYTIRWVAVVEVVQVIY